MDGHFYVEGALMAGQLLIKFDQCTSGRFVAVTGGRFQTLPVQYPDFSTIVTDQGLAFEMTCQHIDRGPPGTQDVTQKALRQ
jgi:hypothetical protein